MAPHTSSYDNRDHQGVGQAFIDAGLPARSESPRRRLIPPLRGDDRSHQFMPPDAEDPDAYPVVK